MKVMVHIVIVQNVQSITQINNMDMLDVHVVIQS
jgi:hypothetical protein